MYYINTSRHYQYDRKERIKIIESLGGEGREVDRIYIEDNRGKAYRILTDNALIVVRNAETWERITVFFARPAQVRKFKKCTDDIIKKAQFHIEQGYNFI